MQNFLQGLFWIVFVRIIGRTEPNIARTLLTAVLGAHRLCVQVPTLASLLNGCPRLCDLSPEESLTSDELIQLNGLLKVEKLALKRLWVCLFQDISSLESFRSFLQKCVNLQFLTLQIENRPQYGSYRGCSRVETLFIIGKEYWQPPLAEEHARMIYSGFREMRNLVLSCPRLRHRPECLESDLVWLRKLARLYGDSLTTLEITLADVYSGNVFTCLGKIFRHVAELIVNCVTGGAVMTRLKSCDLAASVENLSFSDSRVFPQLRKVSLCGTAASEGVLMSIRSQLVRDDGRARSIEWIFDSNAKTLAYSILGARCCA